MKDYYTLITGASQGFGKSMALEFARRKMNLVLVALPNSGLKELSYFIEKNFNIRVLYIETDLGNVENYYKISDFVSHNTIELKYLINNAGILSRGVFDDLGEKFVLKQIEVNVLAPTFLIKLLLKNLKNNAPAGILNVSSMAGFFSLPKKQVYGGTKAYLLSFSKSLRKELRRDNVSVSSVCPGGLNTTTKLCYQNRIVNWITRQSVLSPEKAASIAINGLLSGKNIIVPGFVNKCFRLVDKIIPEYIKDKMINREIEKFETINFEISP
jgi:short-subunit dehydrogenase